MSASRRPAKGGRVRADSGAIRPRSGTGRFIGLLILLCALMLLIGGRLVQIQAIDSARYAERALQQRLRDLEIPARRGAIYDREGEPLAVSIDARTVYAAPNQMSDIAATANAIASVLGGEPEEYLRKLERGGGFVYIARKVDLEKARALADLKLEGVGMHDDSLRNYPSDELACQVLGFVGVDDEGLAGLESYYDELLSGTPGVLLAERDPYGRPIPGGVVHAEDPVDGTSIVLTIDKDIQYHAQVELSKAIEQWGAASGSIIVMDPGTGEILAMASGPGFNPNRFGEADPAAVRNRALTDAYEPGSTIKSLTAAAVIEEGLYQPDSVFTLPPTIKVGGRTIKEAHPRATVNWTLADIVTNSSNVGSVMLGQALGEQGLYEYFMRFGLTQPTGIDFPGEAKGYMPPVEQWSASSIGNIPFGQGVSTTPLQLARAVSVIANGGELVTPHFLRSVPGQDDALPARPKTRALSEDAARAASVVLEAAVSEGTGKNAAVEGYSVAGKTGTAQKARTDGRGYAPGKYVGSFIGYLPAEAPRVLVLVTIDEPKGAIYGGVVAAPVFQSVARFAVSHLRIPPASAVAPVSQESSTVAQD